MISPSNGAWLVKHYYLFTQEEKRLYTDMFGSLKPVTAEEYFKIYHATGLDIDGRREILEEMMPVIENGLRRGIGYIKALPGFQALPMEDKISLIKSKCYTGVTAYLMRVVKLQKSPRPTDCDRRGQILLYVYFGVPIISIF